MKIKRYSSKPKEISYREKVSSILWLVPNFFFEIIYTLFETIYLNTLYCKNKLSKRNYKRKYDVSICAIFKDEAPYLKEWIEYHKLIGIDHIYLYNNNSSDDFELMINSYIESGFVTLVDWPYDYAQLKAYEDCLEKNRKDTKWLGFIDIDEFINLQEANNIKEFLATFVKYPSVLLHWRMFGTSGNLTEDRGLVIERYTSCWPELCHIGKSFLNCDFDGFKVTSPHWFIEYEKSFFGVPLFPIDDRKVIFNGIICKQFFNKLIFGKPKAYINHYWSKSYERYYFKDFIRTDVYSEALEMNRRNSHQFEFHELKNYDKDYSIQRFLILLKLALGKKDKPD